MPVFNQDHLKHFRFKPLFNELGWDFPPQQQPYSVAVGNDTWLLDVVAHKKGVQVLHCRPDAEGRLPDYATRQKIERKVTPDVREHLIVFTDASQTAQVWQWVARVSGKTAQYREVNFRKGETPELLTQKLERLHFTLDEEALLTVLGVAKRLDDAAPREKVTKKFYGDFEKQRKAFAEFIEGIPTTNEDLRWYTAVLIDRLMFLWFLQEKGFLDDKKDYLQARLSSHLATPSDATFYKSFLAPLFFRGFAEERTEANRAGIDAAFGQVPYLNGGLFAQHQLELRYGEALDVADAAFVKLFAFFDEWEWHLDERPLKSGKEINPDVLGYIFEKFVNQKQMGAYYTKEDITDYIGKNTIIPCLLAKVRAEHPTAFDALVWPLLQHSGDAYIYPAMLKGVDTTYPTEILNGLDTEAPDLLARRKPWNKRADDAVSLPTEIWRETIARHQRTREVRAKLAAGDLKDVGDLITYNLDIRQFAQDLIERCTDVALLKSFWFALAGRLPRKSNEKFRHGLSVLDPTCGSGAFLFAALNILKPLYDATLRTLQAVRTDALIAGEKSRPEKWAEVDELLTRFAASKSDRAQDYAVIKHIIVNNLYGVDIEEQATEIAKLRLFLKLVALLEPGDDIEPLPDIDFNIRHGNTLVGYATADETEKAVNGATQGNLFSDAWEDIRIRLTAVEQQYNNFQIQQVQRGGHVSPADKQALVDTLAELEEMLNYHLAREYGVNTTISANYDKWKASHQPFHWYVDFYPLMAGGGFDAVIGNPPYVEYQKIRSDYTVLNCKSQDSGNLYCFCIERLKALCKADSMSGLIVPIAVGSVGETASIRSVCSTLYERLWSSHYAIRPAKLFEGVEQRLTIIIGQHGAGQGVWHTSKYHQWFADERAHLFTRLSLVAMPPRPTSESPWPKIGSQIESSILKRLGTHAKSPILRLLTGASKWNFYFHRTPGYWIRMLDFLPFFESPAGDRSIHHIRELYADSEVSRAHIAAIGSSSMYFWWFFAVGNCRNLTKSDLLDFPAPHLSDSEREVVKNLFNLLMSNYQEHSTVKRRAQAQYQEFDWVRAKPAVDAIDEFLAYRFGLNSEELDFLVSYDIKVRVGDVVGSNDD